MNGIVLTAMNGLVALLPILSQVRLAGSCLLRTVVGFIEKQLLHCRSAIIIMLDPPLWYQLVLFYSQRKRLVVTPNNRVGADVHVTTAASFILCTSIATHRDTPVCF